MQYPINIALDGAVSPEQAQSIAVRTQAILDHRQDKSLHSFHVKPEAGYRNGTDDLTLTVRLSQDASAKSPLASVRTWQPVLDVKSASLDSSLDDSFAALIAQEVQHIFQDEQASVAYLLRGSSYGSTGLIGAVSTEQAQSLERRTTRAFKYASTYHLTFSLFAASATPSAWDIEDALKQYIEPLIRPLSAVSDFTIDTQVQLFASFSPSIAGPQLDSQTNTWKLLQSDLSGFINAAEWPLSPSIGSGPTVNMVVYVPGPNQRPLLLENGGNSWIIPQWGGVQIFNPQEHQKELLTAKDLEPVMVTYADQLMSLLGVPSSPASLSMRISSLKRDRATSLILSASSTLGALVRLTHKLESIAIPATVATSVDETISHLEQACQGLRAGRFQAALEHARTAEAEAEKAFFEPSMVGQVYFPDEHKVAVYVPLLGPMAVPLVMSALKELRALRQRKVKTS